MPKQDIYQLHPNGWESDPEVEFRKVTTLDYLAACVYTNYAVFFRLDDDKKQLAASTLKAGLERTITQIRHIIGTIEKDEEKGGHVFIKKKDSTVPFHVQWLDSPEDKDKYPSFDDLEKANFGSVAMGDLKIWSVEPMTYGEKPEAHPDNHPIISAFKANFIRGGLVLNMHFHHYACDVMGMSGFVEQLADNCYAIVNNTPFPPWSDNHFGVPHFIKDLPPEDQMIDGPPQPQRHPDHIGATMYLFHLPKSKAAELKKLASPDNGTWISTYDAFIAFLFRTTTRLRAPFFKPDMSSNVAWAQSMDMRRRLHTPKCPPRMQGNVYFVASTTMTNVQQPTVAQIISEWPLSRLAQYIRQMTDEVTQERVDEVLNQLAPIRDKPALMTRTDSFPPLSNLQTDHRDVKVTLCDFGFGKPIGYRHVIDVVTENLTFVYPPRDRSPDSDEGPELSISYETRLADGLINDPEWNKYFEYRGIDCVHTGQHH
ncbi:transferase family-domain-containing protein [Daldinia loculata]|uniref:transferase family-domain-containing protein n=1 Tax=Daldinia loculata TaxID=103429 RepID=UPI0020C441CA|nr:transferase family-domain-containing protein [Daldinia loculata]KAI1651896.1 transferase family-domain-containing protein [Daldinia loculata]KAI2781823.1 transferase family-domain-containing protein [Daldinia loculata]